MFPESASVPTALLEHCDGVVRKGQGVSWPAEFTHPRRFVLDGRYDQWVAVLDCTVEVTLGEAFEKLRHGRHFKMEV